MKPLLACAVLLSVVATTDATTTSPKQVACPVCEHEFTVFVLTSTNSFGGQDYDLCSHASGDEPRNFSIWTCPSCRYSRRGNEFETAPAEAIASRIREELVWPVQVGEGAHQKNIPGWVKFHLAATIATWEKAEPEVLAELWLTGSWMTRTDIDAFYRAVNADPVLKKAWDGTDALIDAVAEEIRKSTRKEMFPRCTEGLRLAEHLVESASNSASPDSIESHAARLRAAVILRFRGESIRMLEVLRPLTGEKGTESVRKAAGSLAELVEHERAMQGKCLEFPLTRASIPKLLDLLEDERHWIRVNAVRALREVSGRRLAWNGTDTGGGRRTAEAIAVWREWWESGGK